MDDSFVYEGTTPFSVDIQVRFGDCDPAGIVFYPRYFEMCNRVVEDWCALGLGVSFHEMHQVWRVGLPTVHIEADFAKPSELGEQLWAELTVTRVGGSSIDVTIRMIGPGSEERICVRAVLVWMNLDQRRAVPIPLLIRERLLTFQ